MIGKVYDGKYKLDHSDLYEWVQLYRIDYKN
jgi:hypothetical protein